MPTSLEPEAPSPAIVVEGVSFTHDGRTLLTDLSFTAAPGQAVALIGENGSGKSTTLHLIAGGLEPQAGAITTPGSLVLVHQHLPFGEHDTIADVLQSAAAPVRALLRDLEESAAALADAFDSDPASAEALQLSYAGLLDRADAAEAWALDQRIDETIAGMGLSALDPSRPIDSLSGGQRSRLALAAALVERPWALLLDEPTNHLDGVALDFLARVLGTWSGPVVFASHDRHFLDAVADRLVDLDPAPSGVGEHRVGITTTGGYTEHLKQRAKQRQSWEQRFANERDQINDLKQQVSHGARQVFHTNAPKTEQRGAKKFYSDKASNTIARRVNRARTSLERVERDAVRKPPGLLSFAGFGGRPLSADETLLSLQQVSVAGRLSTLSLDVRGRDRILVTGANGSGKSTLIRVLAGALAPSTGSRLARRGLRVGTLTQDSTFDDLDVTPADLLADSAGSLSEIGLVAGPDQHKPLHQLSWGTRKRVQLAQLVAHPPHVLLLDEPTNHLSLALAEDLEDAVQDFPGAVVIASHDRWLRERWAGAVISLSSESPDPESPDPESPDPELPDPELPDPGSPNPGAARASSE